MQHYPESTIADIEDFRRSGWQEAADSAAQEGYPSLWDSLSSAASSAIEAGQLAQGKILWLLADCCSMVLNPKSVNEPFKPFMVRNDRRSILPEDLQESDIALLAQISEEIDNAWIRARLADLVWLLGKPKNHRYALLAIDAYRRLPLDIKTWTSGGRECWERAIRLIRMLRTGAGERISEIESQITGAFEAAGKEDGFLAIWLSDLMIDNGLARTRGLSIAEKLKSLAEGFENEGIFRSAREFFGASGKWLKLAADETGFVEVTACVAELWVKEAAACLSSENPRYVVAAGFYENAVRVYSLISRAERAAHGIESRLAEIYKFKRDAGERSVGEMAIISSSPVDIAGQANNARRFVEGKSATDALEAFVNIYQGAREEELRRLSEEMLQKFPLQFSFSTTHLSRDGRVVAKHPGGGLSGPDSEEYRKTVWAEMIKQYQAEISFIAQAGIWPALEVLLLEHRLTEGDFTYIAGQSPIVPPGRERLFGRALFLGYERDFTGALHLLVPQIEHMVRWHLRGGGVKTTNIDRNGIENESGLSTLVDLPETVLIFGKDLAFELKALFCDPFGPNLRNELAHGLLDEETCRSVYSIYAWWFGLRLVFKVFWNAMGAANVESDPSGDAEKESHPL
jgi:hypothetical protein